MDKHADQVRQAVMEAQTVPLKKSHGVYWLQAKPCSAGSTTTRTMAALKPVKKVIPSDAFEKEIDEQTASPFLQGEHTGVESADSSSSSTPRVIGKGFGIAAAGNFRGGTKTSNQRKSLNKEVRTSTINI